MDRKELMSYIIGYILGGSFFLLIIPGIIYSVSSFSGSVFPYPVCIDTEIRIVLTFIILIPGILFMVWSNASLFITGKGGPSEGFGIEISPKTKVLVTNGPYRYTRNPMVFGAYAIYLALAVYFNSYPSLILVLLLFPVIVFYLKKSEEKRLVKDFGEDYLAYRKRVSMLIPLPPKK
jgi:protein-S-isoprenylcysteine O-methyltransferase Ste14